METDNINGHIIYSTDGYGVIKTTDGDHILFAVYADGTQVKWCKNIMYDVAHSMSDLVELRDLLTQIIDKENSND